MLDMLEFLRDEGVSADITAEIEKFRDAYPEEDETLRRRVPDPRYLYYGKDIWEEAITAILCARLRAVCLLSPLRPARLRAESLSCSAIMPPFPVHRRLPSAVQQPKPLLLPVRLRPWRKSPACSPRSRRRPCWTTPAWCW